MAHEWCMYSRMPNRAGFFEGCMTGTSSPRATPDLLITQLITRSPRPMHPSPTAARCAAVPATTPHEGHAREGNSRARPLSHHGSLAPSALRVPLASVCSASRLSYAGSMAGAKARPVRTAPTKDASPTQAPGGSGKSSPASEDGRSKKAGGERPHGKKGDGDASPGGRPEAPATVPVGPVSPGPEQAPHAAASSRPSRRRVAASMRFLM